MNEAVTGAEPISVVEFCRQTNLSFSFVYGQLALGRIKATKRDRQWIIDSGEVARLRAQREEKGTKENAIAAS